jgi:hypothetical protein
VVPAGSESDVVTHRDFATFIPIRFVDALRADEVDVLRYGLGCYVAALCFECRNTSGGVAVVRLSELAELFDVSVDTIGRKLHDLEPDWIECDVRSGQRAWRIGLTGLASPARPPHDLRRTSAPEGSPVRRLTSADEQSPDGASPHAETGSAPPEAPQGRAEPEDTRPDPTRPKAVLEERLNPDVVEVRRKTDDDRLLALLAESKPSLGANVDQAHRAADANGSGAAVSIAEDGSWVWRDPPAEGEVGLVADAQALVEAGLARWVDWRTP